MLNLGGLQPSSNIEQGQGCFQRGSTPCVTIESSERMDQGDVQALDWVTNFKESISGSLLLTPKPTRDNSNFPYIKNRFSWDHDGSFGVFRQYY